MLLNHITHRVVVTGKPDLIAAFKAKHIVAEKPGGKPCFDFTTINPMPDILRGSERPSDAHYGLLILDRGELSDDLFSPKTLDEMLTDPWVVAEGITTTDALKEHLLKLDPECVARAERAIELHRQTGHFNSDKWRTQHWGTTWHCYFFNIVEDSPGRFEFMFVTPWNVPVPIFEKLAAEYPGLRFAIVAFPADATYAFTGATRNGAFVGW